MCYLKTQRRQLSEALDITSQIIVYNPSFVVAYIERMYILLEMNAWGQVVEAAQRITGFAPDNIDALSIICLNELCHEGGSKMAATYISTLYEVN